MTRAEHQRLLDLLSKQLVAAFEQDKRHLFEKTWRLLYTMGAQVLIQDGGVPIVITTKSST